MRTSTARAPKLAKKKGRPVAGRPLTNYNNLDDTGDNSTCLRVQFLIGRIGIDSARARLLSQLAWGDAA